MAIVADFDPTTPSIARVYDYLLDGKDNFTVDREVAQRMMAVAPRSMPPASSTITPPPVHSLLLAVRKPPRP